MAKAPIQRTCRPIYTAAEVREAKAAGWWKPKMQGVVCEYACTRAFRVARLRPRKARREYAILHRSPKIKGKWQLTLFDDQGPWGDRIRDTCSAAAQELAHVYQKWDVVEWE